MQTTIALCSPPVAETDSPRPRPPMHNHALDQIFLGLAAFMGILAALVQGGTTPIPSVEAASAVAHNIDLLRDNYLLTVVILGSFAGAAMSYMLYPLPGPKGMAFKFLTSGFSGIAFSPLIATWSASYLQQDMTGMWALAVSALVSFLSWSLLQIVEPAAKRLADWWTKSKIPRDDR